MSNAEKMNLATAALSAALRTGYEPLIEMARAYLALVVEESRR